MIDPATRIGAVHLTISDLRRSVRFYETHLGFTVRLAHNLRRRSAARYPHHPIARLTMSRAVSRLTSGQHEMKISVPWTVPIT